MKMLLPLLMLKIDIFCIKYVRKIGNTKDQLLGKLLILIQNGFSFSLQRQNCWMAAMAFLKGEKINGSVYPSSGF